MKRVANAPCSWGVLEFELGASPAPASQVLDEMAAAGYAGTELGDWGFLPTAAADLASELSRRDLALVGAFVPVALTRADTIDDGLARAVRTARLLADARPSSVVRRLSSRRRPSSRRDDEPTRRRAHETTSARDDETTSARDDETTSARDDETTSIRDDEPPPVLVLSDDNATVPARTARAGRIASGDGLSAADWDQFAARAERIARCVRDETGLRTAFHHHCAGYVETPQEIAALMSRASPELLGLCLDTGHLAYAGGDPLDAIASYRDRIWHVHLKDCEPSVAARARAESWDYFAAVRHGVFCELGRGAVDFAAVRDALDAARYSGWLVVEQDVLPSLGTPAASARRNREYLRGLGL